jgi:hypothetical protein
MLYVFSKINLWMPAIKYGNWKIQIMSCIENKMPCIKKIKYLPLLHFLQCILTAYQFKLCVDCCVLAGFGRVIPASPALLKKSGGKFC